MSWDIHNLFLRHARDIARSLRRGGLSHDTAADLTQDTFLRVLNAQPVPRSEAHNPAAYLYRISRNLRIDHQRKERLANRLFLSYADFTEIADPAPSAEAVVTGREQLAIVEAALADLPERQRTAFELHRLGEMTMAEVGKNLGLSTANVWALIRDAYDHLDQRLAGK
ncbi:RNA polymerase sigma factor [Xinfangfangia sp. D13-10-4-6]|uniref:RNA polymerase sigma factor n=1 Tax=Pseudogemmobacter hezensis TaxID=2737662 RepID=UPI00155463A2|nr:RNA polymerase sigma factor [Pseudogemmobacter hezensis]NPD17028.1 RNA polymerase sigma factor [Pseudogemmobacter hezensis]